MLYAVTLSVSYKHGGHIVKPELKNTDALLNDAPTITEALAIIQPLLQEKIRKRKKHIAQYRKTYNRLRQRTRRAERIIPLLPTISTQWLMIKLEGWPHDTAVKDSFLFYERSQRKEPPERKRMKRLRERNAKELRRTIAKITKELYRDDITLSERRALIEKKYTLLEEQKNG